MSILGSRGRPPGVFRGVWQPNTPYRANDIVTNDGVAYTSALDFISGGAFDPQNWSILPVGTQFVPLSSRGVPGGVATLGSDGTLTDVQRPSASSPRPVAAVFYAGDPTTGEVALSSGRYQYPIRTAGTIVGVEARLGAAPDGQAVIVDVNKNGSTIFTTQSNRPTIAAGTNYSGVKVPGVTTISGSDYLTVDIDQVGVQPSGASATPTFQSQSVQASGTTVTSYDVTRPSGIVSGDLDLLALVSTLNVTWTIPTGWAVRGGGPAGGGPVGSANPFIYVFQRIDDGSAGPWTFTSNIATTVFAEHVVYRGVDQTTPVGATGTDTFAAGNGPNTPSAITTGVNNAVIVYQVDLNANRALSTPTNYAPRVGFNGTAGTALRSHVADFQQAVAGTSDQSSFTIGGTAAGSRAMRSSLRPLATDPPSVWTPGKWLTVVVSIA